MSDWTPTNEWTPAGDCDNRAYNNYGTISVASTKANISDSTTKNTTKSVCPPIDPHTLLTPAPKETKMALFLCRCGHEWKSVRGVEGYYQKCGDCESKCYPESFEWHQLKEPGEGRRGKPHNRKLCGRCKALGYPCVKERQGWGEGVMKVSQLMANMKLVEEDRTNAKGGTLKRGEILKERATDHWGMVKEVRKSAVVDRRFQLLKPVEGEEVHRPEAATSGW